MIKKIPLDNEIAIDAAVEQWHNSDSTLPLYEFLGWTWEEYKQYVIKGSNYANNR